MFVNYSERTSLQRFHGKAIGIDINDRHSPFPSVFIIHEMRVRGHHPFMPIAPDLPVDPLWQDWISSDGVLQPDNVPGFFKRGQPPDPGNVDDDISEQPYLQYHPSTTNAGEASSGQHMLGLNAIVIDKILAATRASASWKACQMEGTSWDGTAQENIQKYITTIGVNDAEVS